MKKILGLTALALLGLVSYASAGPLISPHLVKNQYMWRQHFAAPTSAQLATLNSGYDALGFYIDSLATNKIVKSGAATDVSEADTSIAISTIGWCVPNTPIGIGTTASDSTIIGRIILADAGATTSGIDSVYLGLQVSPDGRNWVYVNQVKGAAGVNPILAASAAVQGFPLINAAGATTTTPKVFQLPIRYTLNGNIYPDQYNWWTWPMFRVIKLNKHVTAGTAMDVNLNLFVQHWSADEDLNK